MNQARRSRSQRQGPLLSFMGIMMLLVSSMQTFAQPGPRWREAPEFLPLFAPARRPDGLPVEAPGAKAGLYRAYVSPLDLDTVLKQLHGDASLLRPPGAWQPRTLSPLDAFGQIGEYNRWLLLRLYGGRPPQVARGPRAENARVVESWTLISPHPDATLQRLRQGTLLLVTRVAG